MVPGRLLIIGVLLLGLGAGQVRAASDPFDSAATPFLYFVENQGQLDPQVSYYLQGRDKTLYFTPAGVTMALAGPEAATDRWVVKLDFVAGQARPIGQAPAETLISYFRGAPDGWQTGLPTYTRLLYPELWPGIDLVYTLAGSRLKYHFTIRPGVDPAQVRLAYRGATAVRLTAAGRLEVSTPAGSFQDAAPLAYQVIDGRRVPVKAAYSLSPAGEDRYEYGFRLGAYDPTRSLVLDPAVIVYAGFIGGSYRDNGYDVAVDAAGNAYVVGETRSTTDFPAAVGPDLTHNGGPYNGDAFIAKVKADGTGLVYAGFIGGSGEDYAYGVAVDAAGSAYVTGQTYSTNFPTSVPFNNYGGNGDAFLVKVNAAGTGLAYGRYIGDSLPPQPTESGVAVAVDSSENAYVLVNTSFGPISGDDTSVVKVNTDGSALVYTRFIGGNGVDEGYGLAVDGAGYAYLTGQTYSSDFPATTGAYDETYNGDGDAFIVKLGITPSANPALIYATYLGDPLRPTVTESGEDIDIDSGGHAYIVFNTEFGPISGHDVVIFKFAANGSAIDYYQWLGGAGNDFGSGLAVDGAGRAYVTGDTFSSDFPLINWPATSFDTQEAYVGRLKADGSGFDYLGFIAGEGTGSAAVAVQAGGNAYVTGANWHGADFPARVGPDVSANGERDAFVVKIAPYGAFLPLILK